MKLALFNDYVPGVVNGDRIIDISGILGDMEHPVREIIAGASKIATLEVGDVFACGTNRQGLGPMQDGETGTIEIERIGRMTVKVEDPQKRRWPVGIDPGMGK